ncbi:MAG: hypothetical protein AAB262_13320 [Elusimicrobiota bacterium]
MNKLLPPQERKKLTAWLIAGAAASLLLPLLAVIYLRTTESRAVPGPSGRSDLFEHREGRDIKLTPTQTVAIPRNRAASPPPFASARPATSRGSSLDFIKTNAELRARTAPPKAASSPIAAQAPAAAPQPTTTTKSKSKTSAKKTRKDFAAPKLQPSRGFSSFKGGKEAENVGHGADGADISEMLKNLPPGAENDPRIQEYLKKK